jgi:HemY protein
MIRALVFIVFLALLAVGLGWLADRPGTIALTWEGWQVRTSLMTAAIVLLVGMVVGLLVLALLRSLLRAPESMSMFFRTRRRSRGFNAVTQGMIAVGSGDVRRAQRQAGEAERILGTEPLALLLRAQAAQLSGDRAAAEAAFTAMLDEPETKPLGLRGLFVEARRRGDPTAARALASEAVRTTPTLPWAGSALLEFQTVEKDWSGALATLSRNAENRLVDKDVARRHRAVLLTARAQEFAERDRTAAKASVLEAVRLAPGLVPAAVLAARLLSEGNEIRKAARVLEAAWRLNPHPDLAEAYMSVRLGDSARDRLSRMQTLAAQAPGDVESAIALARAALAAREFSVARSALAPILRGASERVYLLMADIEEAEHGETGRVREWLSRALRAPRDPAWTADGLVSDVWLPASPVTLRLDAFEWRTPVERVGGPPPDRADDVLADIDEPAQIAAPEKEAAPVPVAPAEPVEAPKPAVEVPPAAQIPPAQISPPQTRPVEEAPPQGAAPTAAPRAQPVPTLMMPPPSGPVAPALVPEAVPVRRAAVRSLAGPIMATPPTPDDPGPDDVEEPVRRRIPLLG